MGLAAHTTDVQQVQIAAEYATGQRIKDLAKKYNRSRGTIHRIEKELKDATGYDTVKGLRSELEHKAVYSLRTALAPTKDVDQAIKQAPVAVQVLKGIGVFASELQAQVSITFEPQALDWLQAKQVGSGSTPAALEAGKPAEDPTPICSVSGDDNNA